MSENERLKEIRKSLELTQRDFSYALDIKQGSYSDVERGKAGISAVLLKNLIRRFRINPLWICEGQGSMFIDTPSEHSVTSGKSTATHNLKQLSREFEKETSFNLLEQVKQLEQHQENLENMKSIIDFLKKGE